MALKFKKPSVEILDSDKKKKKKLAKVEVSAKPQRSTDRDEWVQIAMIRTIPAPRVGNFIVEDELGKKTLKKGKSYHVPENVALHLKDVGACIIVGQEDDDDEENEDETEE